MKQKVQEISSIHNEVNTVLPTTCSEQEIIMIRKGWCIAYNTWWKHKDEGLDFRQMEKELIDALACYCT